jgi:CheY-like chemotaxis protein
VVDDNPAVAQVAAHMIHSLGHAATTASGVNSALSIWNESGRAFDLALIDYMLIDGSGADLAGILAKEKPRMPVLIATGMDEGDVELPAGVGFVGKPFSVEQLQTIIDSLTVE